VVKEIAQKHGKIACFMAKPLNDLPGCSGHIHISLVDLVGVNQFYAEGGSGINRLTKTAQNFLAGVLIGLPSLMAIYAPNINSFVFVLVINK
jgi:glutamine synthetase